MGVNGALAQQAKVAVRSKVAARGGEQLSSPGNFVCVFCHVGLDPHIRVLGRQLTRATQLRIGAGGGKAWGDGIAQATLAMPLRNKRFGV